MKISRGFGYRLVVEHLTSMWKALGSTPHCKQSKEDIVLLREICCPRSVLEDVNGKQLGISVRRSKKAHTPWLTSPFKRFRAGEAAQWLRAQNVFVDDLGSVASTHIWWLTTACDSSSRRMEPLWPPGGWSPSVTLCAHICIQTDTHTCLKTS